MKRVLMTVAALGLFAAAMTGCKSDSGSMSLQVPAGLMR